jgi:hypothetical protein
LTVFDALGVERASIELQGPVAPLPAALLSGAYFCRLSSAGFSQTGKFILE